MRFPPFAAASVALIAFATLEPPPPPRVDAPPPSSHYLQRLPDGEFKRRFIVACTGCHLLDGRITHPNDTARSLAAWEQRIAQMHAMFGPSSGFPIIAEPLPADTLARWLHRYLGGEAPARVPASAPDPRVREYVLPVPRELPPEVAVAPDGRVVITGMFTARMYVLDPESGALETVPIPVPQANPRALHVDADGTWWVVLGAPRQVARRTPDGQWHTVDVGVYAHSIARTRDGVWVNGHFSGHPSTLARVDGDLRVADTLHLPSTTPAGVSPIPYELRTGPDGRLWVSELHGGRVLAVDPRDGTSRAYAMPFVHAGPRRLDVARDGTVWIPLYASHEIVALDPATGAMRRHPLPDRDALPYVVRVDDARDAVWIGTAASDAVYRLDRTTDSIARIPLPSRGALVRHLDVDARTGDLWVAYGASPGSLAARVARVRWPTDG